MSRRYPRLEAITTANYWGDVLQDLVVTLMPLTTVSSADITKQDDQIAEAHARALVDRAKRVTALLTPQRIEVFKESLAKLVEEELEASNGVCCLRQGGQQERANHPLIHQALLQAEIDPFPFGGASIFLHPKFTLTLPRNVQAVEGERTRMLELTDE